MLIKYSDFWEKKKAPPTNSGMPPADNAVVSN